MAGLRERVLEAARGIRQGAFIDGEAAAQLQLIATEAPIEVRAAFDMAIERGDFIRGADVIEHEWPL